jgi:isopenicillin-N epimerase
VLCEKLGLRPLCPEAMLGAMAAMRLPDETGPVAMDTATSPTPSHPLHTALLERFRIEVPVYHWPAPPQRLVRISAQAYNSPPQYERLAAALRTLLASRGSGPAP